MRANDPDLPQDPTRQTPSWEDLWERLSRAGKMVLEQDVQNANVTRSLDGASKQYAPPTGLWTGAYGMIQGSGKGPVK